ncbi:YihY/virulence factor BrkB family protein [Dehalogenimonas sp. 4OHTPN]|uniref:YihY/virulence factor BrkB family protein n=1 Tax=Dehalogenimonas sp. 4OHTPN TaxID=3166643 RepID=A0AAU8GCS4_9CHLR
MGESQTGIKKKIAALRAWAEQYPFYCFLKHLAADWSADDATDRAAAVAYHAFFSLFPLMLGGIALLGFFLPDAEVRQAVSDALIRTLPGSADFIEDILDTVIELRGIGGIAGTAALLWSASNMFAAVRRAVNRAWGISRDRRFIPGKAHDLALVLTTGILFLLSMAASAAVSWPNADGQPAISNMAALGSRLLGFLLVLSVFLIVNKFIPNTPTRWRGIWPGALVSAALFQAGAWGFIYYLTNFADYTTVYGPLGSVIVLLLWIYISSIILILGAEINSELHRQSATGNTSRKTQGG